MSFSSRFEAIVLDLDGTLIETAPDLTAALNHTLSYVGSPAIPPGVVRHMIGDGVRKLLVRGLQENKQFLDDKKIKSLHIKFLEYYRYHIADHSHPFPGVIDTIRNLRSTGVKTAICTNKPLDLTLKLLNTIRMDYLFDAVVGGDTLPIKKPDGGHILGALAAINTPPTAALMIGDSGNDVMAAQNAGLPVVLVDYGYTSIPPIELGADKIIADFRDLPIIMNNLE